MCVCVGVSVSFMTNLVSTTTNQLVSATVSNPPSAMGTTEEA